MSDQEKYMYQQNNDDQQLNQQDVANSGDHQFLKQPKVADNSSIYPNPTELDNIPEAAEFKKKAPVVKLIVLLMAGGALFYFYGISFFTNLTGSKYSSKIVSSVEVPKNFVLQELPSKKMSFKLPPNLKSDSVSNWTRQCQELKDIAEYSNIQEFSDYLKGDDPKNMRKQ